MTSAKDLFKAFGDEPEPPLRGSGEMLGIARRTARRRSHAQALLGAFVLLLVIGGAVLVMPRATPDEVPFQPAAPAPTATAVPSPTTEPSVPSAKAANDHVSSTSAVLMAAVPTGYSAEPATLTGSNTGHGPITYAWQVDIAKGHYRATSLVRVTKNGGVGLLMAIVGNDAPAAWTDHDSCSSALSLGIEGATGLVCDQVVADGVPIRVVSGRDAALGQVYSAVRVIRGGYVEVVFSQGLRVYTKRITGNGAVWQVAVNPAHEPVLTTMPFTGARIAELAADPDLLP
jgi:hypothetical protein